MSFSGVDRCEEVVRGDDEMSDDGVQLGEKKKRLNLEQVKALEKSFELGNKLEPERKMQLARALGLQPRQIAIWFQNRRARWKTKQLEKDYDILKRQFEALKADNDALKSQNNKLQSELLALQSRESRGIGPMINLNKDNEGASWSNNGSDQENSTIDVNLLGTRLRTASADSCAVPTPNNNNSKTCIFPPTTLTHLLQGSQLRPAAPAASDLQPTSDEGFCNMFNAAAAIEEQPGFWPWSTVTDQPHPTFIN